MKILSAVLYTSLFSFFLLGFYIVKSVNDNDKIGKYLATGNVEELSKYFSEDSTIEFPNHMDAAGVEDCKQRLTNFFFNHPPKKFVIKHQGKSPGGKGAYMIGILITANENFRIVTEMKKEKISCMMIQTEYREKKLLGLITQN